MISVRATREGFSGRYRVPGDVFEVERAEQLGSWMEVIDADGNVVEPPKSLGQALAALDPADDAHWSKSGLPDLKTVGNLAGRRVSREEVDASGVTRGEG